MREIERIIILEHPKFLQKLTLHYEESKGWAFEFWRGVSYSHCRRYFCTKNITLLAPFTAILYAKTIPTSDYFKTKKELIKKLKWMTINDYIKLEKKYKDFIWR